MPGDSVTPGQSKAASPDLWVSTLVVHGGTCGVTHLAASSATAFLLLLSVSWNYISLGTTLELHLRNEWGLLGWGIEEETRVGRIIG